MSNIIYHDNLDDRKEMWLLLEDQRMTDHTRLAFVRSCLPHCDGKMQFIVVPLQGGIYTSMAAKTDLLALVGTCGLDMTKMLLMLVDFVKSIHK